MINLIPTPKKYNVVDEEFHLINNAICVGKKEWQLYVETFKENFEKAFNTVITDGQGGFELIEDKTLAPDAYRIESGETFKIFASGIEGINYGLVSAYQLVKAKDGKIEIQTLTVEDYPEKDYRAFMVDLGRIWHPFNTLLHYVDICYMAKIKYLHVHFIDQFVYTLPSKIFPKLPTEGEHYTFEQIAYLNEYAKSRNIVLIPEYECPGHAEQFIAKYPEIFADDFTDVYLETGNVADVRDSIEAKYELGNGAKDLKDTICATSEKCWEATKALLKEICEMFPDAPYINIGGDEANIAIWKYCKHCKKYMEENGLKDEYELYTDYVARVTDYVFTLGKTPMVWEGFPPAGKEKINKDTIIIAWDNSFFAADELLEAGFKIINSSWKPLYIVDHLIYRWGAIDILNWDMYMWTSHARQRECHLNPIRVAPTDRVLGAMLCEWESTYEMSIQHDVEDLGALSERTWTVKRVCYDDDYVRKYGNYLRPIKNIIRER